MGKPEVIKKTPIVIINNIGDMQIINAYVHGDYAYTNETPAKWIPTPWTVTHIPTGKLIAESVTREHAEWIAVLCSMLPIRWNGQGDPEKGLIDAIREVRQTVLEGGL